MSNEYLTTIGLEIHAELKTKSKMWCGCKNDPFVEKPNIHVCEVCMAHPGTLPVANKEAIKKTIRVGLALGADIANFTEFDRKNYFYPDIPKGYQLSQYKLPIVSGGEINGIKITRVHLEEDTAKSSHDNDGYTLVDYNRAGVPLMELVTEPVIHTAEDASNFAKELQRILRYLDASDANMEMGQMRVEANISVSKDKDKFGTKCEVKNLNSFRSVEEAIKYEVARHIAILEEGGSIVQETRGWDEVKQETFSQRKKENAHDYRYFPDPDLPKLYLHEMFEIDLMVHTLPELPKQKRERYTNIFKLPIDDIDIITNDPILASFFENSLVKLGTSIDGAKLCANYLISDVLGALKKEKKEINKDNLPNEESFAALLSMIQKNELSSRGAKDLLPEIMGNKNVNVKSLAESKGLIQKNDVEALKKIVEEVSKENETQWNDFKNGNEKLLMFFVGKCMAKSKGSGNPQMFQEILKTAVSQ